MVRPSSRVALNSMVAMWWLINVPGASGQHDTMVHSFLYSGCAPVDFLKSAQSKKLVFYSTFGTNTIYQSLK